MGRDLTIPPVYPPRVIALGIGGLAVLVGVLVVLMYARLGPRVGLVAAALVGAQLAVQWRVAEAGTLHRWHDLPPPLAPLVLAGLLTAVLGSRGALGRRFLSTIPLAAIVGLQAFRLPLEIFMHQAAVAGIMPNQMSYSGFNFDILTGASAVVVSLLVAMNRCPRVVLLAWNAARTLLLLTIMTIGISSTPTFPAFGPDRLNTFIADPPFVWLPGILVPCAAWGHLLVWRSLWMTRVK